MPSLIGSCNFIDFLPVVNFTSILQVAFELSWYSFAKKLQSQTEISKKLQKNAFVQIICS